MPEIAELHAAPSKEAMPAMSFLDHLEELRRRLVYSIIAVAVGFFACWGYAEKIVGWMQKPIMEALQHNGMPQTLVYLNPTDPFNLYLKIAMLAGLFRCLSGGSLSGVDVYFARALSQRKAIRHALHDFDGRAVPGRRSFRLQNGLSRGAGVSDRLSASSFSP